MFTFHIRNTVGLDIPIELPLGSTLFVLGANGTGKSSLLQRINAAVVNNVRRITASRQTWLSSSASEFAPSQKQGIEEQTRNWNFNALSRHKDQHSQIRPGLTLYDLIESENVDARAIARALRSGDTKLAESLATEAAPIAKINMLLADANIPITISVEAEAKLTACKLGSAPYGVDELSDGERNALLIAADTLTAKPGTLLIIDEPERHLHRSIVSPLLTQLFALRSDCAFIVATHELGLPRDNVKSRCVLIRSCLYNG